MAHVSDTAHLCAYQYSNSGNLCARIALHDRFSTNHYGWHRWLFDQFDIPSGGRILELGGGSGTLWLKNADRIPADWEVFLSDMSSGMLEDARRTLEGVSATIRLLPVDAQAIPFEAESFDTVVANYMLYHVPDRPKAFSEIRRVLKPGGRLYAATFGRSHLQELRELVGRWYPQSPFAWGEAAEEFGLETGLPQLAAWFSEISVRTYEDALLVTEAEPLLTYILSDGRRASDEDAFRQLAEHVHRELKTNGVIHIKKHSGLFLAR